MVKDKSPNPGTRNRKPVLVIPCSPTPTFWYIEIWHHLRWWWWREWPVVKNYLTRYDKVLGNQVLMKFIKYIVSLNFSEPNGKSHNYINIWINLSTAANSIVYIYLLIYNNQKLVWHTPHQKIVFRIVSNSANPFPCVTTLRPRDSPCFRCE